ncbi:MAG TPA: biotin--[acetyl-CoA-carboxylase] ligase [Pirellulales bacterium]
MNGSVFSEEIDVERIAHESFTSDVRWFAEIDSTNDHALRLSSEPGLKSPILIVADEQTAGRGRGRNRWWTGPGSLAFSLLCDPKAWGVVAPGAPLSLAVGVALVEAVSARSAGSTVGLHWPNDVFAGTKKISGVLVEGAARGLVVVGVGLNVNNSTAGAPPEVAALATSLIDLAHRPQSRTDVLIDVLFALDRAFSALGRNDPALGRRFDDLCLQRERDMIVDNGPESTAGVCRGVAPDGALLLDTMQGVKRVYSGVVRKTN